MSLTQTANTILADAGNFTYNASEVEFISDRARLKLQNLPGQVFTETFTSSTGFTFDPLKAEFTGGVVRQKDQITSEAYSRGAVVQGPSQRPAGATFGATYTSSIDGSWGNGTLTGTATGGATVSGGKLVCTGTTKSVQYVATGNADSQQVGCIRLKLTPNYSGAPLASRFIFSIARSSSDLSNSINLAHYATSNLVLSIYNSSGVAIFTAFLGVWTPVSGTEYEFEVDYDLTAGATRLFINGTQLGATQTGTGTRSVIGIFNLCAYYDNTLKGDFSYDNVEVFNSVQHVANYTPGYTIAERDYLAAVVPYSTFTYAAGVVIDSLSVPTIVSANAPHYVVNGQYWSGAAWAASSDTYATSMDSAAWIANYATFPSGSLGTSLVVKVVFQDTNTAASVTSVALTINEHNYAETAVICPEMVDTNPGTLISFDSFTATDTASPRYTLQIGRSGNYLYWNGGAWVTSDGSYAQANTKSVFNTNCTSLPVLGQIYEQFKVLFGAGITQMSTDSLSASLTAQIYPTTNPTITMSTALYLDQLVSFAPVVSYSGSDLVKYCLLIDGTPTYWNGTAWATASGAYAQSNTLAEIQAHISSLSIALGVTYKWMLFLHSATGATSPYSQSVTTVYDFYGPPTPSPDKCYCYCRVQDILGFPVTSAVLNATPTVPFWNGPILIPAITKTAAARSDGYIEMYIYETTTANVPMVFSVSYLDPIDNQTKAVAFSPVLIPDVTSQDLSTLLVIST